ncbi:MAG: TonB-dependent receptor [Alistipes sp.]
MAPVRRRAQGFRRPQLPLSVAERPLFQPGGNDSLKTEKGYTYEGGMEFRVKEGAFDFGGEATVYNSHIRDWIVWLPTFKGFWTPLNVKKVHSYGVELRGDLSVRLGRRWALSLNAFGLKPARSTGAIRRSGTTSRSANSSFMFPSIPRALPEGFRGADTS